MRRRVPGGISLTHARRLFLSVLRVVWVLRFGWFKEPFEGIKNSICQGFKYRYCLYIIDLYEYYFGMLCDG